MAATYWKEPKLLSYCLLSYCKYVLHLRLLDERKTFVFNYKMDHASSNVSHRNGYKFIHI